MVGPRPRSASAPAEERTLTGLSVLLQAAKLSSGPSSPYCLGGAYGRLLDAESRTAWRGTSVQVVRDRGASSEQMPRAAVLAYLFHRIEGTSRRQRPTLLIVDEGWLALDDDEDSPRTSCANG